MKVTLPHYFVRYIVFEPSFQNSCGFFALVRLLKS